MQRMYSIENKTTALPSFSFPLLSCQVDSWGGVGNRLRYSYRCICVWLLGGIFATALMQAEESLVMRAPLGLVWEVGLAEEKLYDAEVRALIEAYEAAVGHRLACGARAQVGIKVNTRGGRGLSTPLQLLRAVIEVLEARGFERESILIVDYSTHGLRQAGIMPSLSSERRHFEGCPVYALDSEQYYDADWFYESPLPPSLNQEPQLFGSLGRGSESLQEGAKERKSFLPAPLLFEVDFWLNLAVGVDDAALGVDGVLANATLWNVSNSQRFLSNEATASAAVAEIAAIPELNERMVLHMVSLDCYQYIGGPRFNARYAYSEPLVWMSSDPVALDRLLYDRMNTLRLLDGFPEISPLPRQLPFAASLGLGQFDRSHIHIQHLARVEATPNDSLWSERRGASQVDAGAQ